MFEIDDTRRYKTRLIILRFFCCLFKIKILDADVGKADVRFCFIIYERNPLSSAKVTDLHEKKDQDRLHARSRKLR